MKRGQQFYVTCGCGRTGKCRAFRALQSILSFPSQDVLIIFAREGEPDYIIDGIRTYGIADYDGSYGQVSDLQAEADPQNNEPDPDPREPPVKRRKRTIFRACDNCVHAKTRCEDVAPDGCSLCRRRKKVCSLAGQVEDGPDDYVHPPPRTSRPSVNGNGFGGDASHAGSSGYNRPADVSDGSLLGGSSADERLQRLEQAVLDLQAELRAQPAGHAAHTARSSVSGSSLPHADHHSTMSWDDSSSRVQFVEIHKHTSLPYCDALYTLQADDPYPSVIRRGIFSSDGVDMAFHTFKHIISSICPLSTWLSMETPTPTHPFVILAMLHHVPAFAGHPALPGMVDESLLLVMRAQLHQDVVLALLILSLAPATNVQDTPVRPRPTALRLITMAYDVGRGLGIPASVKQTARRGGDLGMPGWEMALQQLEMWMAVVDQYNLLQILLDNPEQLVPTPDHHLTPDIDRIHHVYLSHQLQLQETISRAYAALQAMMLIMDDPDAITDAEEHMRVYSANFALLNTMQFNGPSSAYLKSTNLACRQTLCMRTTAFLVRLPTPLKRLRELCKSGMQCIKPTCAAMLLHLVPDASEPPTRFTHPTYIAQSGLVACLMLLAAVCVVKTSRPAVPIIGIDPPRLSALVKLLRESDPVMRIIIDRTESLYGRTEDVAAVASGLQSLASTASFHDPVAPMQQQPPMDLTDLPLDPAAAQLFDLDLMGWDFLLPEWTEGLGR